MTVGLSLICFVFTPAIFLAVLWYLKMIRASSGEIKSNKKIANVLFVVAHPDDECMFFGPSILSFKDGGKNVKVACLSRGNWYGQGDVRTVEFARSCQLLGVRSTDCILVDNSHLEDNPSVEWPESRITAIVRRIIKEFRIDTVVTFDAAGVSGHKNHISLHRAISAMNCPGVLKLQLETVNVLCKYLLLLDVLRFLCTRTASGLQRIIAGAGGMQAAATGSASGGWPLVLGSPLRQALTPARAMLAHRSQLLWFRYLYIVFSRYMAVNTLHPMES